MKRLQEYINEMASTKFDLKHAFNEYKTFGVVTDDPNKVIEEKLKGKEIKVIDINNTENLKDVLDSLLDIKKPLDAICWILNEKNDNACNMIMPIILKGTYNGKEINSDKQIVFIPDEHILTKPLHSRLNPFIKI